MPSASTQSTQGRAEQPQGEGIAASLNTEWLESTLESVEQYARKNPWPFALGMLGIGFVLGWKLKGR